MRTAMAILGVVMAGCNTASNPAEHAPARGNEQDRAHRLIEAAYYLDVATVEAILKAGTDVNARYGDGNDRFVDPWTLGWPMGSDHWTALIAVASSNTYPDPPRPIRNTAEDLRWASDQKDKVPKEAIEKRRVARLRIAEALISAGADVNLDDGYGGTALSAAAGYFDDLAILLIENKAEVRTKTGVYIDGPSGVTALHKAVNSPKLVKALIQAGADVNAQTSSGDTPLDWAENEESIRLLKEAGAKPNKTR